MAWWPCYQLVVSQGAGTWGEHLWVKTSFLWLINRGSSVMDVSRCEGDENVIHQDSSKYNSLY